MRLTVFYVQLVAQVLSEALLAPPQDVHVENGLLTWTPAAAGRNVTYTVQYRSVVTNVTPKWEDAPACVQTSSRSCNVALIKAQAEHGCVTLRVRAQSGQLTAPPAEACSRHGDSCTPEVSVSARPGSLTVHLSRNHSMALEHGDHALHRVFFGKDGEPLQKFEDAASSVSVRELQEGQRYCTKVQYILFRKPVGLPSCTQCEVIPESTLKHTEIIVALVVVGLLAVLIPVIAYVLIFQRGRIKEWLRPPYEIPDDFFLEPFPEHRDPICPSSPSEEHWDVISCITPEEFGG